MQIRQLLVILAVLFLIAFSAIYLQANGLSLPSMVLLLVTITWFLANGIRLSAGLLGFTLLWLSFEWFYSFGGVGLSLPVALLLIIIDRRLWRRDAVYSASLMEASLFFLWLVGFARSTYSLYLGKAPLASLAPGMAALCILLPAIYFARQTFSRSLGSLFFLSLIWLTLLAGFEVIREYEYFYLFTGDPSFSLHPSFISSQYLLVGCLVIASFAVALRSSQHRLGATVVFIAACAAAYFILPEYISAPSQRGTWAAGGWALTKDILSRLKLESILIGLGPDWKQMIRTSEYTEGQYPVPAALIFFLEGGLLTVGTLFVALAISLFSGRFFRSSWEFIVIMGIALATLSFPILRDPLSLGVLGLVWGRAAASKPGQSAKTSITDTVAYLTFGVVAAILLTYLAAQCAVSYTLFQKPHRNLYTDQEFKVPKHFIEFLLAAEDLTFFYHRGVDFYRMKKAAARTVTDWEIGKGGSTISMQLAKVRYLHFDKTFNRKVQQVILAVFLENEKTKEEILKEYLATIGFAPGSVGITKAAFNLFNKTPDLLSQEESLQLVMSIPNPLLYNPTVAQDETDQHIKDSIRKRVAEFRAALRPKIERLTFVN